MQTTSHRVKSLSADGTAKGFRERTRYILRAMACLRPYWYFVLGAYVVAFLSNGISVWIPMIMRGIVDDGIRGRLTGPILSGCVMLVAISLVKGIATFFTGRWTESASQGVAFDLRNRFHQKLQALSFSFHDESETGQLLARSVSDVDRIRFLTGRAVLHLVQMLTLVLGISVAMIIMNPRLGLACIVLVPFIGFGAVKYGSILRPLSMTIRNKEADLTSDVEQNLRGARIVKAFGQEPKENQQFSDHNQDLLNVQLRAARLRAVYNPLMQFLAAAVSLIVLMYGGSMVIRGELTIGELVAFSAYVAQLMIPIRRFGWMVVAVAQASASAERIFDVLDLKSEIADSPTAVPLKDVTGRIRFDQVSFSYARGSKVLDDIELDIEPGEKVALLGTTGSGKSSIINLIPRFYDPTSGRVLIDGVDIRDVTVKSLRDHIGTVLQDTVLFAATIRENIAFGRPEATHEEIVAAAEAAHAHEFIADLDGGYDADVGEQGVTLSGGQKQRLSIARALLKDPEILILDDATSSVDTETESLIQDALRLLMENRTSIVIAQRLSTIREADKVLVLDKGKIAAVGLRSDGESPHEQLLRTSGLYAEIYERQLRPAELGEPKEDPR